MSINVGVIEEGIAGLVGGHNCQLAGFDAIVGNTGRIPGSGHPPTTISQAATSQGTHSKRYVTHIQTPWDYKGMVPTSVGKVKTSLPKEKLLPGNPHDDRSPGKVLDDSL